MSLGGIAIAIGAMVDAAIVMIENAHKHLEQWDHEHPRQALQDAARWRVIGDAAVEVGPALFFSLLIITLSFVPVFALQAQEGRLFAPLAYTKTFSMAGAALLSVTLVPVLMMLFIRGKIMPEAKNPLNRFMIWVYRPIIAGVMRWKKLTIALAVIAMALTYFPASKPASEFTPTPNEGTLLYMPASLPGMSITKAAASSENLRRWITLCGLASERPTSDRAMPMVLVPRSSPIRRSLRESRAGTVSMVTRRSGMSMSSKAAW